MKDLFKIGYVLVYKRHPKDKFFGTQIAKAQRQRGFSEENSEFTHVEISSGDFDSVNITFPRAKWGDITEMHKGRVVRIYRPKVYDNDFEEERKRLKVAVAYNAISANKIYDFMGVLKFKLPFLFHLKDSDFCSEGVATAIKIFFPEYFPYKPNHTFMPADFTNEKYHTLIGEIQL